MRIVFTGGSGKAGPYAIDYLLSQGHKVLNLDLAQLNNPNVYTLKCDLTDSGQVFNALSGPFDMSEYGLPEIFKVDAVIHFGAYARNLLVPDNRTFTANVTSTYNVIEAASKLGIKKIIIASSECAYGVCFHQGPVEWESFPIEEDTYDCNPQDPYAISKLCGERIARSFAKRFSSDIYAFRIGNVIEPHEYAQNFPGYIQDPESRMRNAWSYIDARDLGQMCDLAVKKDGLGFQVFNATNDNISLPCTNPNTYLKKIYPNIPHTREMGSEEAPLTNCKIKEMLGFKENHDWKQYVDKDVLKKAGDAINSA